MRIIAGSARGRRLKGPRGPGLRPTSDQVREALFNILGERVRGARVLDLFAGTGALSLEALSRGADHALLIDCGREALALCRDNAALTGCGAATIEIACLRIDARLSTSPRLRGHAPFDLAFADPPYAAVTPQELLTWLDPALLAEAGLFVIEHDRRTDAPSQCGGFVCIDERRHGDTALAFYRPARPADADTAAAPPAPSSSDPSESPAP